MVMARGVHDMVRLNRHSFLAGPPEQVLINYEPQDKYPTEVTVFKYLHNPLADRFVEMPFPALTMNGQRVDTATHLMCSRCCQWKMDTQFYIDRSRIVRRGRCYYCMDCMDRSRLYRCDASEESPRQRRKKRRKH